MCVLISLYFFVNINFVSMEKRWYGKLSNEALKSRLCFFFHFRKFNLGLMSF